MAERVMHGCLEAVMPTEEVAGGVAISRPGKAET